MKTKDPTLGEKIQAVKLMAKWSWQTSRIFTVIILIVTLLAGTINIIEPYIFKLLLDRLVEDTTVVGGVAIAVGSIILLYGFALLLQQLLWDGQIIIKKTMAQRLERTVAKQMMDKVSSLDAIYFEDPEYYNTLQKAHEQFWRINEFFWHITFCIGSLASIIIITITFFKYIPLVAILVLAGSIPQIWTSTKSTRLLWGAFDAASPISREANYYKRLMTERPEALKEIRLFNLSGFLLNKFDTRISDFIRKQDKAAIKEFGALVTMSFSNIVFSVISAFVIIKFYMSGEITVGTLTFLWALLFQFSNSVKWTVSSLNQINEGATFATPYVKILGFKPNVVDIDNPRPFPQRITQGIEFRNVSFIYPGAKKPSLKNVSFFIKAGENIALVGENGSGKTTLVKLLCRLYDPTQGEIFIDGVNIKEFSLKDLYSHLGVIFQDFMKYEASVAENIGYGNVRNLNKNSYVEDAARKSGAHAFIVDLEKEYKSHLGKTLKEEGTDLSIGQWQKVALARAFFKDADIMVLDEPTAAVDAQAEYELFRKFENLTREKTTVLISHRFSTVRMANKILVLENGKIIEEGSHKELLRKNGHYAHLFKLQAEGYQ